MTISIINDYYICLSGVSIANMTTNHGNQEYINVIVSQRIWRQISNKTPTILPNKQLLSKDFSGILPWWGWLGPVLDLKQAFSYRTTLSITEPTLITCALVSYMLLLKDLFQLRIDRSTLSRALLGHCTYKQLTTVQ